MALALHAGTRSRGLWSSYKGMRLGLIAIRNNNYNMLIGCVGHRGIYTGCKAILWMLAISVNRISDGVVAGFYPQAQFCAKLDFQVG